MLRAALGRSACGGLQQPVQREVRAQMLSVAEEERSSLDLLRAALEWPAGRLADEVEESAPGSVGRRRAGE